MGLALFVVDDSVLFDMLYLQNQVEMFLWCWLFFAVGLLLYYDDAQNFMFTLCVPLGSLTLLESRNIAASGAGAIMFV